MWVLGATGPAVDDSDNGFPHVALTEMLDELCIADDDAAGDTAGASAMMVE